MKLQDVQLMYEYNDWANHRLLEKAANVTPEQFVAPSSHSFGSLQATLVHTLDTEIGWRGLLKGEGFSPDLNPADFPTVAAIQQRWAQEEQARWDYLNSLSDDDLAGTIRYHTHTGVLRERVLWHCLFHLVNHGMQHRSEAATLLTGYGQSPGDIDFTVFLNERAAQS
jgi:uncharacterized damage-inducible protein DinB